jgi:hypothetical protein
MSAFSGNINQQLEGSVRAGYKRALGARKWTTKEIISMERDLFGSDLKAGRIVGRVVLNFETVQ